MEEIEMDKIVEAYVMSALAGKIDWYYCRTKDTEKKVLAQAKHQQTEIPKETPVKIKLAPNNDTMGTITEILKESKFGKI